MVGVEGEFSDQLWLWPSRTIGSKDNGGRSGDHMEVDNDVMDRCKMETKQKQDEMAAKLNNIFMD